MLKPLSIHLSASITPRLTELIILCHEVILEVGNALVFLECFQVQAKSETSYSGRLLCLLPNQGQSQAKSFDGVTLFYLVFSRDSRGNLLVYLFGVIL